MFAFALEHVRLHRQSEFDRSLSSILAMKNGVSERDFFLEYLWCVYVSGFSAKIISSKYKSLLVSHNILDAAGEYIGISPKNIVSNLSPVLSVFKNRSKAKAVQATRRIMLDMGWAGFYGKFVKARDPQALDALPNIGPALACHLARNLGNLSICKPDVHLNRLAGHYGFATAMDMCKALSDDEIGKTDMVLWYAAADHGTK